MVMIIITMVMVSILGIVNFSNNGLSEAPHGEIVANKSYVFVVLWGTYGNGQCGFLSGNQEALTQQTGYVWALMGF